MKRNRKLFKSIAMLANAYI